jgi:uncharacterized membrane protein YfcA
MTATWTAVALGSLIGLILAFTGAGGGILAIPLLVLALHLPVQEAGPVGLLAVGLASAVGAWIGWRSDMVRYRAAGLIGTLGMLVAPLGVVLAQYVPDRPLMAAFGLVMAYIAWRILRPAPRSAGLESGPSQELPCQVDPAGGRLIWTSSCARALAGTGLVSGLLSGLLGVGGGFVIVPALMRHTDLDTRSVQATSLAVIALVSISGVVAASWHGSMNWQVALPFAGGAILSLLAVQPLARGLDAARLRQAFAWLCLGVALMMWWRAAAG